VDKVRPDGTATFVNSVPQIDMRQRQSGQSEVRYNSRTDAKPPLEFQQVAPSVGVPLSVVTINSCGKVLHRERAAGAAEDNKSKDGPAALAPANPQAAASSSSAPGDTQAEKSGWLTIPLPEKPIAVGESWSLPLEFDVHVPGGATKRIRAIQQFTLEDVKTGVATIRVSTDILTPVSSAAVESQLIERQAAGRVRFDIDAGRVLGQQLDTDKHVVGFRGEASSIHYVNRFCERLLPESQTK